MASATTLVVFSVNLDHSRVQATERAPTGLNLVAKVPTFIFCIIVPTYTNLRRSGYLLNINFEFSGIDSPESFQTSFLIGLAIAIGCSFVILAIILLSIFIKRRIEQGTARKALKQYLRYGATDTGYEESNSKRYLSYNGPINPALRASSSSPGGSGAYSSANVP